MALPPIEEALAQIRQRNRNRELPPIDEALAEIRQHNKPLPVVEEALAEGGGQGNGLPPIEEALAQIRSRQQPPAAPARDFRLVAQHGEREFAPAAPDEATVWKGLRRGTANTLEGMANVSRMRDAQNEAMAQRAAEGKIGEGGKLSRDEAGWLADQLNNPASWNENALRKMADAADPGEYAPRKTAAGRFGQSVVESIPYTLKGLAENAPLSLLGPAGAVVAGIASRAGESQTERADVYAELIKRGLSHGEAYERSSPVHWQDMAALSASDIAQNILTFAGNRIVPGAGRALRIGGALVGDALMEAGEEGIEKVVSDKALGDKTDLKELLYEMGIGGASGFLFSTGGMTANRLVNGKQNAETDPSLKGGYYKVTPEDMTFVEPKSQPQRPEEGQTPPAGTTMPSARNETPQARAEAAAEELSKLPGRGKATVDGVTVEFGSDEEQKAPGPQLTEEEQEAADEELMRQVGPERVKEILGGIGDPLSDARTPRSVEEMREDLAILDAIKRRMGKIRNGQNTEAQQQTPQSTADQPRNAAQLMNQKTPEGDAARKAYNEAKQSARDAGMAEKEAQKAGFDAVTGSLQGDAGTVATATAPTTDKPSAPFYTVARSRAERDGAPSFDYNGHTFYRLKETRYPNPDNKTINPQNWVRDDLATAADDIADEAEYKRHFGRSFNEWKASGGSGNRPKTETATPQSPETRVPDQPRPQQPQGKSSRVSTASGMTADTRFKVVDAGDLIASNTDAFGINPAYPQELQPRQRDRAASKQQIENIVSGLNPGLLGESSLASDGAPIVGPDNVVESGNGRVMALRAVYGRGDATAAQAARYRKFIEDNAGRLGVSAEGIRNPVLVRERVSGVDRRRFAQDANVSGMAAMSSSETAMRDAGNMSAELLAGLDPDIDLMSNREFMRSFARDVVPRNEAGAFMDGQGRVSADGVRRVQNALFAKAYGDAQSLARMSESTDDNARNVSRALLQASPAVASMQEKMDRGLLRKELSLAPHAVEAANTLTMLRNEGTKVSEFLPQGSLFEDGGISPEARRILAFFDRNKQRPNVITKFLAGISRAVESAGAKNQKSLFDERPVTLAEIIGEAEKRYSPQKVTAKQGELYLRAQTGTGRQPGSWAGTVEEVFAKGSTRKGSETVGVMPTPPALELAGAAPLPVRMSVGKMRKVGAEHRITPEMMKQVPQAITDPVMIFASASTPNSLVVMTELRDSKGATVIIPVHLAKQRAGEKPTNWLASVYGRQNSKGDPNDGWFISQIRQGNLRYINTEKGSRWITGSGLSLPKGVTIENLAESLPTEADLVKNRDGSDSDINVGDTKALTSEPQSPETHAERVNEIELKGEASELEPDLIRRANDFSALGMQGDSIARQYKDAIERINRLDENNLNKIMLRARVNKEAMGVLEAATKYPSVSAAGPAMYDTKKGASAADAVANARARLENYVKKVEVYYKNRKGAKGNPELSEALQSAVRDGKLEVVYYGTRYYRKNRRTKAFAIDKNYTEPMREVFAQEGADNMRLSARPEPDSIASGRYYDLFDTTKPDLVAVKGKTEDLGLTSETDSQPRAERPYAFDQNIPQAGGDFNADTREPASDSAASLRRQTAAVLNEGIADETPPMGFSIVDVGGADARARAMNPNNPLSDTADSAGKFEFLDREAEERYQRGKKSIDRSNAMAGLKESAIDFVKGFASDFPKIAGQKFDLARETLRKMNRKREVAITDALGTLRASVKDMSPGQYDLFSRKAILDDLTWQKQETPDSELPYGFTDASLKEEHGRVTEAAGKDPVITKALERERGIVRRVNRDLTEAADRIGWHSMSEKFKNPHYFRHVVIKYAEAAAQGRKAGLKAPENRGYYKRRRGSAEDIMSNYVQAMGEVRALQMQDIEIMKALKAIKDGYDISERLKRLAFAENEKNFLATVAATGRKFLDMNEIDAAEFAQKQLSALNKNQAMSLSRLFKTAGEGNLPEGKFSSLVQDMADAGAFEDLTPESKKQFGRYLSWLASLKDDPGTMEARTYFKWTANKKSVIERTLGKENVTWRDMMPEGYAELHPFQNRLVFSVNTVAENVVEMALEQGLNELSIPIETLRKMNVLGGHRQSWAIPQELAETLEKMGKPIERGMLGKAAKAITSLWKIEVLLSPWRVVKYNLRNVSGDADAVMTGNPDSFRFTGKAFHDLYQVYKAGKEPEGELAEFAARGGAVGSLHLAELGDETAIKEFQALLDKGEQGLTALPPRFWHSYWNGARMATDFRENNLRYATYLSYLDQMQKSKDGTPNNYGASKRSEVLANQDIRDRAYKLANELLGAYDQVSETGRYLRDITFPFFSWLEVNARRYWQIFKNGMEDGDIGQVAKRTLMGQVMKSPVYAWRLGKTAFKISLFTMLIQAFNHLVFPDEEDDLPPDVRNRPHLTLGRGADGKVRYFDRIGALADVLDWFSLDTAYSDIKDILNGQQSVADYAKKMAMAPVNKLFNAINPIPKTAIEIMSGKQYYPDVSNPRSIRDMGVYLANTVGLSPEFVAITGRPSRGYLNDRLGNMFSYSLDPDEAAYWWILDKKRQFQENVLGTEWSGGASTSARGRALWNIKRAVRFGDRKAVGKYARQYLEYGGTDKGLDTSLRSMSPDAGLSGENQAAFYKWLSAEDRKYLKKAYKYYGDLLSDFGLE